MGRTTGVGVPLLALLAVVCVAAGYSSIGAIFEKKYSISAAFSDINGLIVGNEVRAGGVQVGRVSHLELGPDKRPVATLELQESFKATSGTRAALRTSGPASALGAWVELLPGPGTRLADGAGIPRRQTTAPEQLDQVISALDPPTRVNVRRFFAAFDAATSKRGPDVAVTLRRSAAALGETAELAGQLRSDGAALRTLLGDGRRVVNAIERDPGSLGGFADQLSGLLQTTAERQQELAATVRQTPGGVLAATSALNRLSGSVPELRRFVSDARPGVRELRSAAPELRTFFAGARTAFGELDPLVASAPQSLRRLRPLLRTAPRTLPAATKALKRSAPVLDELRVRTPDVLSFFTNWADFLSNYDANGNVARFGLSMAGVPRRSIDKNSTLPGRVKLPYLRVPGTSDGDPWNDYESSFLGAGK